MVREVSVASGDWFIAPVEPGVLTVTLTWGKHSSYSLELGLWFKLGDSRSLLLDDSELSFWVGMIFFPGEHLVKGPSSYHAMGSKFPNFDPTLVCLLKDLLKLGLKGETKQKRIIHVCTKI